MGAPPFAFLGLLCCFLTSLIVAVVALGYAGLLVPSDGVRAFSAALGDAVTGDFGGMRAQWGEFTDVLDTDPLLLPTLSYKVFASITAFLIIVHLARWGILKHIMRYKDPDKAAGGQKQASALLKSAQKKIIDVGFAQLEETLDSVIKGAPY